MNTSLKPASGTASMIANSIALKMPAHPGNK